MITLTPEQSERFNAILKGRKTIPERYEGLSDDDAIELIRMLHGGDEKHARFVLALERGEVEGDTIPISRAA